MVIIFDPQKRKESLELRDNIRRTKIPCGLSTEIPPDEDCYVCVYAADCFEVSLPANSVDAEKLTPVFISELKGERDKIRETSRILERICDILFVKYGISPDSYHAERFVDTSSGMKYASRKIILTETERIIVRYLTAFPDKWMSAEQIISSCLQDDSSRGAVAVHITNINAKGSLNSNVPFIETRRGSGYRFKIRRGANS